MVSSAGSVLLGRAGVAPVAETRLPAGFTHRLILNGAVLIDDPTADRLVRGEPSVGWEGDPRLALYLSRARRQWELWRLEADGTYRQAKAMSTEGLRGIDAVGAMLIWLVTHDGRRGYKVIDVMGRATAATEVARDVAAAEQNLDVADHLGHALIVDGVQPRDFWSMTPTPAKTKRRRL